MTAIDALLNQPGAQAIGWALVHFMWQGTLIAAVAAVLLAVLRGSAADVRYVVAAIGLTLMATMPAVTAVQTWRATVGPQALDAATHASVDTPPSAMGAAPRQGATLHAATASPTPRAATTGEWSIVGRAVGQIRLEPWIPALLLVWLCGVTLLTLRLASGWVWVRRSRSRSATPAAACWQLMASRLASRLHVARSVRLLQSTLVDVPTVVGWLRPVVLLPASALAGLSPNQMEAILAHELAHIRRHDYLVNLLQALVETLLFYHPAVWWLSRRIRTERENCCDDLAVSLCGDPLTYASALADLEELRGAGRDLVLAATGGSLVHRIRRLLGAPSHAGREPGWLAGSIAILLMFGMAAGAVGNEALAPDGEQAPIQAIERPGIARAVGPAGAGAQMEVARALDAKRVSGITARIAEVQAAAPVVSDAVARTVHAVRTPAAAEQGSVRIDRGRQRGNFVWSNNGDKIELRYDGEVEFTDDDTDVTSLSPGGIFRISDGGWFGGRGVEFRADASGAITRRFRVGIVEKPFEPDGRAWLARTLPRFIRQSGIGAPARVARLLKAKGPAGVLAEIAQTEGSYGKRIYFAELFNTASLDAATVRQALAQASREIESDYELASLLIASQHLVRDDATRKAYFDASSTIQSDYELGRALSAGLKAGPVAPAVLAGILDACSSIESDYELASLLVQVARLQPLDAATRRPLFTALEGVGSAYEHGRVLNALAARSDVSSETLVAMLQSGARLRSDYEQAQFLLQVAKGHRIDATLRGPFFAAADGVRSSFEKGRVLQAVAKRSDIDAETVLAMLRSAASVDGNYERSQVLLAVAAGHPITGTARDAYVEAAEKLGEYEQGRVLSALVRNERSKR